ncbi:MAG: 16S rRNA (guanine(966)-N(2))-methyltransferase RsmD [Bacteroidales bacterium]|nr:16S rRNA (guanine(966)-N(2))-methyltransferase RsmD [Bacteroidales bacterium]
MRIISGTLKGRVLTPPKSFAAHPTTDYAKEGLFNILENSLDLSAVSVLDLFSGSGNIAFEFASRGCPSVVCVEMDPAYARFISKTAESFGVADRVRVVRNNVFDFLNICTSRFHIVFADPPYDLPGLELLPQKIMQADILGPAADTPATDAIEPTAGAIEATAGANNEGLIVLEHPAAYSFSNTPSFQKTRKYGHVHFSFFAVSKTLPTFALPNK